MLGQIEPGTEMLPCAAHDHGTYGVGNIGKRCIESFKNRGGKRVALFRPVQVMKAICPWISSKTVSFRSAMFLLRSAAYHDECIQCQDTLAVWIGKQWID